MKKTVLKLVLTALVAGMSVPLAVHAADDELQMKIDKLSKEVADLQNSVKKVEDKSLGKWLTIGGEYRFRLDSLHGQTTAYSDAIGTMGESGWWFYQAVDRRWCGRVRHRWFHQSQCDAIHHAGQGRQSFYSRAI